MGLLLPCLLLNFSFYSCPAEYSLALVPRSSLVTPHSPCVLPELSLLSPTVVSRTSLIVMVLAEEVEGALQTGRESESIVAMGADETD